MRRNFPLWIKPWRKRDVTPTHWLVSLPERKAMGKQEVSALTDYNATTTSTSPPSPLPLPLISRFPTPLSLSLPFPLLYHSHHPRLTIFPLSPFSFSFSFSLGPFPSISLSISSKLAMELHHHVNPYYLSVNPLSESGERDRDPDRDRDRLPQWTHAETKEFLAMRAELDQRFMETKRNKPLWQGISARLQQKGFIRTPEQCKSKWKNLVTRFKASEVTEGEGSRQFPFYEEMRMIFSERMERLMAMNKDKGKGVQVQGEEWGEEEEEEQEEEKVGESKKKRKVERKRGFEGEVENALREFARRQLEMEARWMEASEAREAERRAKELEWRRAMEALEEERKLMERRWREREEERRAREEARADRRDALVTALLAKLTKEEL